MKKRITWVDWAKGLTILLVVCGHVTIGLFDQHYYTGFKQDLLLILVQALYGFHMPVFFALSGYFFKTPSSWANYGQLIKKRSLTLGIPYLFFSIVIFILMLLGGNQVRTQVSWTTLFNIWQRPLGLMWFLYVLWALNVVFGALARWIKDIRWLFALALTASLLANIWPSPIFCVQQVAIWAPCFLAGTLCRRYPLPQKKTIAGMLIISYCLLLFLWWQTNPTNRISYAQPGWQTCFFLIAILIAFTIFPKGQAFAVRHPYFTKAGQTSLGIYLFHVPVVSACRWALNALNLHQLGIQLSLGLLFGWFGTRYLVHLWQKVPLLAWFLYPSFSHTQKGKLHD